MGRSAGNADRRRSRTAPRGDPCASALRSLAKEARKTTRAYLIGITGSVGKTGTKEALRLVLKDQGKTYATDGNLNNHIGVPLTLLSMDQQTEFGIVEMGANHPLEIAFLCTIANPDYGYITNFGHF